MKSAKTANYHNVNNTLLSPPAIHALTVQ